MKCPDELLVNEQIMTAMKNTHGASQAGYAKSEDIQNRFCFESHSQEGHRGEGTFEDITIQVNQVRMVSCGTSTSSQHRGQLQY